MPKNQYFLLASTAVAAAIVGAYGSSVVVSEAPISGAVTPEVYERTLRPLPPVVTSWLGSMISGQPCIQLDVQEGQGTCNASRIDYVVEYRRHRGQLHGVVRFPEHRFGWRMPQVPASHATWLASRVDAVLCSQVNQRYGDGTCDGAANDFRVRFIRTGNLTRGIAEVEVLLYATGASPPQDNQPEGI